MTQLPPLTERDLDEHPYSSDEQRVADFLYERGVGGGDDPIGFLLASYADVVAERNEMRSRLAETTSHIEHTEAGVEWPTREQIKNALDAQDGPVSSANNPNPTTIAALEEAESGGGEVTSQTTSVGLDWRADIKEIRPLQTLAEYESALKEIESYFKNVPVPGTEAADRFNALSLLIKEFEDSHFPIPD
jgi:hypothetical protein